MTNKAKICCILLLIGLTAENVFSQTVKGKMLFNADWKFHKGDIANGETASQKTTDWRTIDLPHDWSIEGPYSEDWASATGYLPGGIGWYQKTFDVPANWKSKNIYIYFEGVYKNSTVWVNGHNVGNRPNGFISFEYELSKYLNFGRKNSITVKVDHTEFADSRWYTGSGIYRDVYLIVKDPVQIANWGVQFTTPKVTADEAEANAKINILNTAYAKITSTLTAKLIDAEGKLVATATKQVNLGGKRSIVANLPFRIKNPQLWSVDQPALYHLNISLAANGKTTDEWTNEVGVRNFHFDPNNGFFLNGQNMKLKGVCIHDDAGALGVAVPEGVWRRRLMVLKEAGVNSIRMSHNPHAEYLYKLCDELGFLVMDEAFDEWEAGKNKWIKGWNAGTPGKDGYHEYFTKWADKDLGDMVLRDYNHPSIIMWSIGNEIDYPNDPYSSEVLSTGRNPQIYGKGYLSDHPAASRLGELSKQLVDVVKANDTTRPVTAALAGVVMSNTTTYPENLDIVGYNYQEYRYDEDHKKYPKRVIYGSENGMQLNAWLAVDTNRYIAGQYLWTGIDYLGEAGRWPTKGSGAGLIDLAGFPKPEYYFRQSIWSAKPMIYIGTTPVPKAEDKGIWSHRQAEPNWNWKEGDKVRVNCFTNCAQAELFLNGKSMGIKAVSDFKNRNVYWDIDYQPGELTVKGYNQQKQEATYTLKTSGTPFAIKATAAPESSAKNDGLVQVIIQVVDEKGIPIYNADNEIAVTVAGKAKLTGLENSDLNSHEDYKANHRKVFHGKLLGYVQGQAGSGNVTITVSADGLKPASFTTTF